MNLNEVVEVVLSQAGVDIYNNRIVDLGIGNYCENVEEGHVLRTQLWSLFSMYGDHVGLGREFPFVCGEITLAKGK